MKYNQPYGVSDPNAPYINGNPATGQQGSIPPAASIEYPQREIVNLISDTGRAPDNADLHQLGRSIQTGLLNYADDTGTANAYACNLSPAPTGYTAGLYVVLKIKNTNTGASVFNINSMGNKPIVRSDGSDPVAGDLPQGVLVCLMYDGTNFQMVWSMKVANAGGTIYLTRPVDFYVNGNTGSDAYDGLTAAFSTGIHGPFKTLQKASNVINQYNLNGFGVAVHVADANYAAFLLPSPSGTGTVTWTGNTGAPANCLIYSDNYTAVSGSQIGNQIMEGFKLKSSGVYTAHNDPLCCIYLSGNMSTLSLGNMEFAGSPGAMVSCGRSAILTFAARGAGATYTISGGSPGNPSWQGAFCYAFMGGNIQNNPSYPPTMTISAPISIQNGWMSASINANAQQYANYVSPGNVTGIKFTASLNGVINSSGSGVNYYPGTIAGTQTSGGQYA
ncbi:hypothetical protein [Bradyrhizobium sp. DASA03120]|uniref:hypothetical protein n=1 Tax=Bradyrhizobium sp. SMVTL-02 TaxID=3395917 RepID=UPI003F7234FD